MVLSLLNLVKSAIAGFEELSDFRKNDNKY